MTFTHKHSLYACCVGYVTQAVANNFMPLLFAMFGTDYGISLEKIGLLITINFVIQMAVDFSAAKYTDKFGYRSLIVMAHFAVSAGLGLLGLAPIIAPGNIYPVLVISIVIYAVGGGLIEVLVSPMVEAMPTSNKVGTMNILHSFYCWGQLTVTALSTVYFVAVGVEKWYYLSFLWALIPLFNALLFLKVPVCTLKGDADGSPMKALFTNSMFWLLAVLMICAGASELAMAQWASYFAEMGLGVTKTLGDVLGPCAFAVLMGVSRLMYSRFSLRLNLTKAIGISSVMCAACYFVAALSPYPLVSVLACAVSGFTVGIMWPGVYSLAARKISYGGTTMFALLALAGDVGCTSGPSLVGWISGLLGGGDFAIKMAMLTMAAFPIAMALIIPKLKAKI